MSRTGKYCQDAAVLGILVGGGVGHFLGIKGGKFNGVYTIYYLRIQQLTEI